MGRVARYKPKKEPKFKPRVLEPAETDRLHALPPPTAAEDARMPRSMIRLMQLKAKLKKKDNQRKQDSQGAEASNNTSSTGQHGQQPQQPPSDSKAKSKSGQGGQGKGLSSAVADLKRKPKESLADFGKRVDTAAASEIYTAARKVTNKAAKRKAWSEEKKQKKRDRGHLIEQREVQKKEGDALSQIDQVKFGEVVEAPPQIKAKPRNASNLRKDPLLLTKKLDSGKAGKVKANPRRQQVLDAERERVISAYRNHKLQQRDQRRDA